MAEEWPITIAGWKDEMARAWRALRDVLDAAGDDALTSMTDAAGWSAKDHIAHLDACAYAMIAMFRDGQPEWVGLGVDEALFREDGYDRENEVIRLRTLTTPLADVRVQFRETHKELLRVVGAMTDEDLRRPCSAFVPGAGDVSVARKLSGNTAPHYEEHRAYIQRLLRMDVERGQDDSPASRGAHT